MRLDRASAAAAALVAAAVLAGCEGGFGFPRAKAHSPRAVDPAVTAAALLTSRLEVLQRLVQSPPAEQAQILAAAKRNYESAPTAPGNELQYALVLAAPGHPGSDPAQARELLRRVLTSPQPLTPSERALAVLTLQDVERQLDLAAENQRLQTESERNHHELLATASRRQAESEENARLRKELEKTRAQLNAIANIERSLTRQKPSTEGPTQ